jgi:pimeloyl-ACP methyl ester carboxylesterase
MPGTGSDDVFVRSVFATALDAVGVPIITPAPKPGSDLVSAHLAALDRHSEDGPVLVGGISLGAHLAVEWALRNPGRCAGVLLALPAWTGVPNGAPAALSATASADLVRSLGLAGAVDAATADVPDWLATELRRAWTGYGDGLADSLDAAIRPSPTAGELAALDVPAGVAGLLDDPIHPVEVARAWASALPRAALCTTRLAILGADPAALGRAAVLAWLRAGGKVNPAPPGQERHPGRSS